MIVELLAPAQDRVDRHAGSLEPDPCEVVARRPDGTPYSHIGDLQQARDGLRGVRRALAGEIANPPESITQRGAEVLQTKYREANDLLNRTNNFLRQIGQDQTPPYHRFPEGS